MGLFVLCNIGLVKTTKNDVHSVFYYMSL